MRQHEGPSPPRSSTGGGSSGGGGRQRRPGRRRRPRWAAVVGTASGGLLAVALAALVGGGGGIVGAAATAVYVPDGHPPPPPPPPQGGGAYPAASDPSAPPPYHGATGGAYSPAPFYSPIPSPPPPSPPQQQQGYYGSSPPPPPHQYQQQQYQAPPVPPPPFPGFGYYGGLPQLPPPSQDAQASEFLAELKEKDAVEVGSRCLAPILETVVDTNDRLQLAGAQPPAKPSIFRLRRPPTVSLRSYVERIVRVTGCSPQCLVTALVYLDRVAPKEYPSTLTIHRLLLAAIMLASKHTDAGGSGWGYAAYTRASGLPESELKVLEVEMLKALSYDLVVPPRQLFDYGRKALGWKRQAMFRPENP